MPNFLKYGKTPPFQLRKKNLFFFGKTNIIANCVRNKLKEIFLLEIFLDLEIYSPLFKNLKNQIYQRFDINFKN